MSAAANVYTNDHCIFEYCPNPESCEPDGCAHPRPLTPEEQALLDNAWEKHKAAEPPREFPTRRSAYEGNGGWADGRLGQAYDLIDAVMRDQHPEHDSREMLRRICGEIEAADIEIGAFA